MMALIPYYITMFILKSENQYSWTSKRAKALNTKKGFLRALIPFNLWVTYFTSMWEEMPDE